MVTGTCDRCGGPTFGRRCAICLGELPQTEEWRDRITAFRLAKAAQEHKLELKVSFYRTTPKEAADALRWIADRIETGEQSGEYNYPLAFKWTMKEPA